MDGWGSVPGGGSDFSVRHHFQTIYGVHRFSKGWDNTTLSLPLPLHIKIIFTSGKDPFELNNLFCISIPLFIPFLSSFFF
jgi:hypothetical protein